MMGWKYGSSLFGEQDKMWIRLCLYILTNYLLFISSFFFCSIFFLLWLILQDVSAGDSGYPIHHFFVINFADWEMVDVKLIQVLEEFNNNAHKLMAI